MFWLLVVWFLFGFFGGAFFLFVLFRWLTGFPVLCIWDAQVRRHFQDCHHRHDERSNGAKKKTHRNRFYWLGGSKGITTAMIGVGRPARDL